MKNVSKLIICLGAICLISGPAHTACEEIGTTYIACKPGYYLTTKSSATTGNCAPCPGYNQKVGELTQISLTTSPDQNTGGITSCYLPVGAYRDTAGQYTMTSNCNYTLDFVVLGEYKPIKQP